MEPGSMPFVFTIYGVVVVLGVIFVASMVFFFSRK